LDVKEFPKVGEPFDQLRRVVLVELDVGKVHLQNGRGRITHITTGIIIFRYPAAFDGSMSKRFENFSRPYNWVRTWIPVGRSKSTKSLPGLMTMFLTTSNINLSLTSLNRCPSISYLLSKWRFENFSSPFNLGRIPKQAGRNRFIRLFNVMTSPFLKISRLLNFLDH
jgi:hypothetical protein